MSWISHSRATTKLTSLSFRLTRSTSLAAAGATIPRHHRSLQVPANIAGTRLQLLQRHLSSSSSSMSGSTSSSPLKYPAARREEHYDTYKSAKQGEVKIHSPYKWLEEPPSKSEETKTFVEAQERLTREFLQQDPNRDKLQKKLTENWDYARFSCPSLKKDNRMYYTFNSGLQPQAPLYRIEKDKLPASIPDTETEPSGELFFDPNRLSSDGTASLASSAFSETGKYWAYGVSRSGSDWFTIYVRKTSSPHSTNTSSSEDEGRLTDVVRFAKYCGITFLHDDSGFLYQRYPTSELDHGLDTDDISGTGTTKDENAMLFYHRLGTKQEDDILIYKDTNNPDYMYSPEITDDGKYLILSTYKDTAPSAMMWIAEMKDVDLSSEEGAKEIKWNKVVDKFGAQYACIANDGSKLYFMTNFEAPKYKLVTYDYEKPDEGFTDLIAEDPDSILTSASVVNQDTLLLIRSRDVKDELTMHVLQTGEKKGRLASNLIGSFAELTGRRHHKEIFFKLTGFSNPGLVYRYSFENEQEGEKLWRSTVVKGLKQDVFGTEQVFYTSKDGTKVPMFIVTPRGVPKDGTAPCLQYGYGGFSHSMDPFFSPEMLTFIKQYGARLAVANIRGGSEYGEAWHEAGTKERKQNVFDDFQYATKYLIDNKYAAPKKVAIYGGSNGGLLVAACANQAPDLFGCILCAVGVLDMLSFQKYTIGRAWCSDYGCSEVPEEFDYLYAYSPLHNIPTNKVYPPTMLLTGDHDDRVVPLHSFKMIAALQHAMPENPNPLLMRVALKAGHGAGKSTQQRIEEAVDRWGFVALTMGLEWRD